MKTIFKTVLIASCVSLLLFSCTKDDDSVIDTNNKKIPATSAQFYKKSFSLAMGGREKVMLTLEPEGAILLNASWSSSDTTIVKVDSLGIVTAIATGEAAISLTAGHNISGECTVKVIESPITGLVMPEARFPIAKDAIVFLQGTGFTANSKIILRHHTDFKSTNGDEDILAQIQEQTMNYLSFAVTVSPGLYNIVLDENGNKYDFGNIEVEIPNIPEYEYDNNKIFWGDTHWRRFQLRGKVKEVTITSIEKLNSPMIFVGGEMDEKVEFNNKGCIIFKSSHHDYTYFTYDSENRLVKQIQNSINLSANNSINTIEFKYGNHNFYYPIELWSDRIGRIGTPEGQTIWVKGLTGIDYIHDAPNNESSKTENVEFAVSDNSITAIDNSVFKDSNTKYLYNYVYTYNGFFPVKMVENFDNYYDMLGYGPNSRLIGQYNYIYEFSSNGMPIKQIFNGDNTIRQTDYVENCPFYLISTYCEYDKNWNLIKRNDNNFTFSCYYQSYDKFGNWTQCIGIEDQGNSSVNIYTVTREFTYW